jgi:hypothetical protein
MLQVKVKKSNRDHFQIKINNNTALLNGLLALLVIKIVTINYL